MGPSSRWHEAFSSTTIQSFLLQLYLSINSMLVLLFFTYSTSNILLFLYLGKSGMDRRVL